MMMTDKLILGTAQMGLEYGINNEVGKISEPESLKILEKAFSAGIRYLDTAEVYGSAHQVIGKFHQQYSDRRYKVITKLPEDVNINDVEERISDYLEDLKVDMLEAVMFHSFTSYKVKEKVKSVLIDLRNQGIFNYLGVSVYRNSEIEFLIEDDDIDLIQLPFNLLDNRNLRGEMLRRAKQKDKIIHTRSAFLQGLFFKKNGDNHPVVRKLMNPLGKIRTISNKNNKPIEALALLYCLQQKNIDKVIIGVDSIKQLEENVNICDQTLESDIINELDSINIENKNINLLNPSLWP